MNERSCPADDLIFVRNRVPMAKAVAAAASLIVPPLHLFVACVGFWEVSFPLLGRMSGPALQMI